jgi:exodeoxyribonuclease VII large subunit
MDLVPIGTLVRFIREWIEASEAFSDVWAVGEVSNHSCSTAGHQYFTLKDEAGSLRMVLFRGDDRGVAFASGDRIFVHGRVSVYEARGELQFICDFVRPEGVGILAAKFAELRERLEREGLFELARKRPLPPFPRKIGVVTSPTGAALQDIRNVLEHRWPLAELVLSPALVQGDQAPVTILRAMARLAAEPGLDLVILARGGGSAEDLAAFNDEAVARAVFAFPVPVVTGVGHDTDESIVDYVGDVHAPTPSAAAARATPDIREVRLTIERSVRVMGIANRRLLGDAREELSEHLLSMRRLLPDPTRLAGDTERALRQIRQAAWSRLERASGAVEGMEGRLRALSPLATLERGYAIVHMAEKRKVVQSTRQVKPGMRLLVSVKDGAFATEVS